ncbi:SDR family NAD(P)-dependent oxidoreductase [Streptomyces asoensis]|uniref:SDR family NAD(P)-dependent oxidoreductase n=1 Tax=Streptomyces asoensis TaxID=249586 RepID=A0A6M4WZG8_9ACTN|nr:SDR family NAD(P)-dependent oxidoreductase [Streptomyces asoensis]QJT05920.1 SDR family NAD(P)-dependent oxidoreductase [Streptomyces asoensis]
MSRYDLAGRTVVITGSTGGLGSAVAAALHDRGAHLALLGRDESALAAQADMLGGPRTAWAAHADVTDLLSLRSAIDRAADHFGRVDIVVANAGVTVIAPTAILDPDAFERVIDVNLTGVWRTFKAALPHVERQRGYLLAVSSMAAFVHSPLQGPYTASKAGVWAMCNSIRLEVRHLGVDVGTLHPTFLKTPMLDAIHADPAGRRLWSGNERGLWRVCSVDKAVRSIVSGIERRAQTITPHRLHTLAAAAPGVFRPVIDRVGFTTRTITEASAAASPSGGPPPTASTVSREPCP